MIDLRLGLTPVALFSGVVMETSGTGNKNCSFTFSTKGLKYLGAYNGDKEIKANPDSVSTLDNNQVAFAFEENFVKIPGVEVGSFSADKIGERAVRVDLVLDVGNSRTCALMIENNGNSHGTAALLRSKYQLRLRDLCDPTIIYRDAFPSRVEFALPSFKCHELSVAQYMCGGEPPAGDFFSWPSLVRTGFDRRNPWRQYADSRRSASCIV